MNLYVGSIFWNNDFIFPNKNNRHFQRPCIVLSLKNDFIYFLPLSHSEGIYTKNFVLDPLKKEKRYIPLTEVFKIPEKASYTEIQYLEGSALYNFLLEFYTYQTNLAFIDPDFVEIKGDIEDTLAKLSTPCQKMQKKNPTN